MPVVDVEGDVVGTVTLDDLVPLLAGKLGDLAAVIEVGSGQVGFPGGGQSPWDEGRPNRHLQVGRRPRAAHARLPGLRRNLRGGPGRALAL